ncbi:hypothetical protein [Streptomyces europaeiscabiei]|uniref:hypothetical protein n=1 Tax=Streptomyces europaeiscabiei TaxID=146819 RepID=UPI002E271F8D|nr:hypothetical protein OG858_48035 [Streptomyces europaeiscabiei]
MDQPADQPGTDDYTPTAEGLREIAQFLRRRSLEEAGEAGVMDYYRQNGVTVRVDIASGKFPEADLDGHRSKVTGWMDEHSPTRFTDVAHELANMADALAEAGVAALYDYRSPGVSAHQARGAWWALTRAARLWDSHPEFLHTAWSAGKSD